MIHVNNSLQWLHFSLLPLISLQTFNSPALSYIVPSCSCIQPLTPVPATAHLASAMASPPLFPIIYPTHGRGLLPHSCCCLSFLLLLVFFLISFCVSALQSLILSVSFLLVWLVDRASTYRSVDRIFPYSLIILPFRLPASGLPELHRNGHLPFTCFDIRSASPAGPEARP